MISEPQLAQWLSRLVRVPSVSPDQAGPRAGVVGEAKLAEEVARCFARFGGEVSVEEVLPGRPNIIGRWRGRSDRLVAVDAHLDTVGVEAMTDDPFSGRVADNKVFGRGATDTKATLAVVLALLEAMHQRSAAPGPSLLIAATVDEESGARGAPALAAWLRARGLMLDEIAVAEPTLCGPVHGHKGVLRLRFRIEGKAAHSSQPALGKSAVSAGVKVAAAMEAEHARLATAGAANPLGPGTLMVTVLRGGESMNIVPPSCEIVIDRRLTHGENAAAEGEHLIALARQACALPLVVETIHAIDPFFQPLNSPFVGRLAEWSGMAPALVPYCTNAWAYPSDVARHCVVIGPGSIDQAHTADEWVAIAELSKLASIYALWWEVSV